MKYYKNVKTGNIYKLLGVVINSTNAQDGQQMVMYQQEVGSQVYVREYTEFYKKFEEFCSDDLVAVYDDYIKCNKLINELASMFPEIDRSYENEKGWVGTTSERLEYLLNILVNERYWWYD